MGLRRWVYEVLSRGQAVELDPNEPIDVTVVGLSDGPMLVSALEATGLHVIGIPRWNVATRWTDRTSIVVPRHEEEEARAVLADLRSDTPGTYIDWVLDRRTDEVGGVAPSASQDETNGDPT